MSAATADAPSTALAPFGAQPAEDAETLVGMTKVQKLAALMVALGPDTAIRILQEFDPETIEAITGEMVKIEFVSLPMQRALAREFTGITVDAVTSAAGGASVAMHLLERSLGTYKANEVINRIAPQRQRTVDSDILREVEPRQLANLLRREQPQTWALVLSMLDPASSAEVLMLVAPDMRTDIVERIATLEGVSQNVINSILDLLKKRTAGPSKKELASSGGIRTLAQVLNNMDPEASRQMLTTLEQRNPDLSRSIKKLLFTFDDLAGLDKASLTRLLREVDFRLLAVALKTADEKLQKHIFSALTKRASEMLSDELKFMPPVRVREVEAAQEQIVEVARNLEASGEIVVNTRGDRSNAVV